MRGWVVCVLAAGCYGAHPEAGAPCGVGETCPSDLECVAHVCVPPGTPPPAADAGEHDAPVDARPNVDAPVTVPDAYVDPSLVAHWTFDTEPSAGALDSTGRGHTGACVTACPTLVDGKLGKAYHFAAASAQAIRVPDSTDFRGPFTVAIWMRADSLPVSTGDNFAMMSKPVGTASGNSWQLELHTNDKYSFTGGSTPSLEGPVANTNTWHHVAGTWDGTTKRLYVDGVEVASLAVPITYDTHEVYLGADNNSGSVVLYWDGVLDDARVYNRVLSAAEIAALAQ